MQEKEGEIISNKRLPSWMRRRLRESDDVIALKKILRDKNIHTVCQSAGCPNICECFRKPTATFMILGDVCTRNCRFCGISKGKPLSVDPDEPRRIAEAAKALDLKHVVITSVTRDDLEDGGAEQFARTVEQIHEYLPEASVEVLIPDLGGCAESLKVVLKCGPDILNHNVETVPRLYAEIRPEADFERSLDVLRMAKDFSSNVITKSGLMVGFGESRAEMSEVFSGLIDVGCDALTIGQYLSPTFQSAPVHEYVHPEIFDMYRETALTMGFRWVYAGPFVRSSFNAEELMKADLFNFPENSSNIGGSPIAEKTKIYPVIR